MSHYILFPSNEIHKFGSNVNDSFHSNGTTKHNYFHSMRISHNYFHFMGINHFILILIFALQSKRNIIHDFSNNYIYGPLILENNT